MPYRAARLPLELALPAEPGKPFTDIVTDLVGGDRRRRERLVVYVQQWDHLADDLGRPPTVEEYAERWSVPISTAYRSLGEFRQAFPTERDPARLVALLWDGLSEPYLTGSRLGTLLGVRVRIREAPDS